MRERGPVTRAVAAALLLSLLSLLLPVCLGFAAMEPAEFPSLHVGGLKRRVSGKDLEQLLAERELPFRKVKRVVQKPFAFVSFNDQEACDRAKAALDGVELKGCKISIAERSFAQKRKWDNSEGDDDNKKARPMPADVSAPWAEVPYSEQVRRKQVRMCNGCVHAILREVTKSYKDKANRITSAALPRSEALERVLPQWLKPFQPYYGASARAKQQEKQGKGKRRDDAAYEEEQEMPLADCVEVLPLRTSDDINGYRNKNEFTFGYNMERQPTLGFRMSSYHEGVNISSPLESPQIPRAVKLVVAYVTAFIRRPEALPVYDAAVHAGVYRLFTVRYSKRTKELLCMLCVSLQNVEPEVWQAEQQKLVQLLRSISRDDRTDDESLPVGEVELPGDAPAPADTPLVNSTVLQVYDGLSVPPSDHPIEVIFGRDRIMETMMGLKFDISPQAFFQVNTAAAEVLYSTIIENLPMGSPDTHVLDVCCGTGTIGLCCAKAGAAKVTGIEMNGPAVEDAKANAELNGVGNTTFICSKAEAVLASILKQQEAQQSNLVAVVDPPRAGLHKDCLRALRKCEVIQTLVYVACNPTGALVNDATVLCGPSSRHVGGRAFRPVRAIPVDLFPHTPHCEMVMVFERLPEDASAADDDNDDGAADAESKGDEPSEGDV